MVWYLCTPVWLHVVTTVLGQTENTTQYLCDVSWISVSRCWCLRCFSSGVGSSRCLLVISTLSRKNSTNAETWLNPNCLYSLDGVMIHGPVFQTTAHSANFTRCSLWALNVALLKRRLRIIQWQHVASLPASAGWWKSQVGHIWIIIKSQAEIVKTSIGALKRGIGKYFLIKALQKQKPQAPERSSPTKGAIWFLFICFYWRETQTK